MKQKSERLWNSEYIKVMLANFTIYFAFYILTPLLPIYLSEHFHATNDIIGIVLSGYTVVSLLTRPFSGFIVDSFDRKKVLLLCFALFAVFFAGYLAATSLVLFAIVRTLHGGPFGAVTVANSTAAIDVLPSSRRNEGIGYFGLSNNIGMAVAPMAGIFVYNYVKDFNVLFWIALGVATIGFFIISKVRIPQKEIVRNKRRLSLDRFFLTRAWMLAVNIAFFGFCFGLLSNYLAIYSKEVLHQTSGTGAYFTLLSVGLILSRLQGSKALREGRLTYNAAVGMIVASTGYILFVAVNHPVAYYLSALLIGLGNGHMYPAFLNMFVAVARHDQRGTANSSILTSWDVGFGLGILLGGIVSHWSGYQSAFIMTAAVNCAGTILFFLKTKSFFLARRLR